MNRFPDADLCACNNKEKSMARMSRKQIVERMLEKLQEQLVYLEALPEEPKAPENSPFPPVIYFVKKFPNSDQEYTYVFYKAPHDGRWYGSGEMQSGKSYTWDELMHWLESSGPMPVIYKLTGYEEYWTPEEDED